MLLCVHLGGVPILSNSIYPLHRISYSADLYLLKANILYRVLKKYHSFFPEEGEYIAFFFKTDTFFENPVNKM